MQLDIEGGNRAAALAAVETNLAAIRTVAEEPVVAQALIGLGWLIWVTRHDAGAARTHLGEGLALAGAAELGPLEALGRTRLSAIAYAIGDYPESQRLLEENERYKASGGESLLGYMDEVLHARMLLELGDFAGVEALLANLAPHVNPDRHPVSFIGRLMLLCWTRLDRGDLDGAATAAMEGVLTVQANLGRYFRPGHLASPLEALVTIAAVSGEHARALRLEAAAARFREQDAILRFPLEQRRLEDRLAACRAALGAVASAEASEAGRNLSVAAAIAEATSAFSGAYTTAYSMHRPS
jgi:hypothetical protein